MDPLNSDQLLAAQWTGGHLLVTAGAGTGKTTTLVNRIKWLLETGTPPDKIQALTFTRKAAGEIKNRVNELATEKPINLPRISTFHSWCLSIAKHHSLLPNTSSYTIIDTSYQCKLLQSCAKQNSSSRILSKGRAIQILNLISYAKNMNIGYAEACFLQENDPEVKPLEIEMMENSYALIKRKCGYLDFDDILLFVKKAVNEQPQLIDDISEACSELLIDEAQDTNPLQWDIIQALSNSTRLFCVGDDAQSIYGFRGADFESIHQFTVRIPNSSTIKLKGNYRSTQQILSIGNWLLDQSCYQYNKQLYSTNNTSGQKPCIRYFLDEFEEAKWLAKHIGERHSDGIPLGSHLVLARNSSQLRALETQLILTNIPYTFLGGKGLIETNASRLLVSIISILCNIRDELSWKHYLSQWAGIGQSSIQKLISSLDSDISLLEVIKKGITINKRLLMPLSLLLELVDIDSANVSRMIAKASSLVIESPIKLLEEKSELLLFNRVATCMMHISEEYLTASEFLADFLLSSAYDLHQVGTDDDSRLILSTMHSAKGLEYDNCYLVDGFNMPSPKTQQHDCSLPGLASISQENRRVYSAIALWAKQKLVLSRIEEERRILYVALTRAAKELTILTRGGRLPRYDDKIYPHSYPPLVECSSCMAQFPLTVFLDALPEDLVVESCHISIKDYLPKNLDCFG